MTDQQKAFLARYLIHWNAARACREAGYTSPGNIKGSQLRKHPEIKAAIEERLAEMRLGRDEVIGFISEIAAPFDLGQLLKEDADGTMAIALIETDEETGERRVKAETRFLKKITITDNSISIETHDRLRALEDMAKVHALFVDKTEISGPDGGPVTVKKFKGTTSMDDL